jgi:hypothetical protein
LGPVLRALSSSLLSLLLVITAVWGGCVSCEQFFTLGRSHGCCNPAGNCKRSPGQKGGSERECKLIAFDKQKGIDLHFDLPAVHVERIARSVRWVEVLTTWRDSVPPDSSPPGLQVLNSVFLV